GRGDVHRHLRLRRPQPPQPARRRATGHAEPRRRPDRAAPPGGLAVEVDPDATEEALDPHEGAPEHADGPMQQAQICLAADAAAAPVTGRVADGSLASGAHVSGADRVVNPTSRWAVSLKRRTVHTSPDTTTCEIGALSTLLKANARAPDASEITRPITPPWVK